MLIRIIIWRGWVLEEILDLAKKINDLHKVFGDEWFDENSINLKKQRIEHVCFDGPLIDPEFYSYIIQYIQDLTDFSLENIYSIDCPYRVINRTKNPDSIVAKLIYYRHEKAEKGIVSINKCLNDLMGLRVFVENYNHKENFTKLCEVLAKEAIKVHNSCKGQYKATHLYFQNENNKLFPWELQIWNTEDEEENIHSHQIHKQDYTNWPRSHVESKIIRREE